MNTKDWLDLVAYTEKLDLSADPVFIYRSKYDSGYIGMAGQEEKLDYLAHRGITEQLQTRGDPERRHAVSIGFCPSEQKWYGWSHRAIFGFGIGSECKKGDCGYVADNPEELIDDYANFYADISDESAQRHRDECQILPDRSGIRILHAPLIIPMVDSIDQLSDALDDPSELPEVDIMGDGVQIVKCGRGAWTAETLEDAKQMAIDFAESVS